MKPEFSKIYLEITNVCNADCSFCPKTSRTKGFMSIDEFKTVISKIKGRSEYLCFHLMGEPLLHPQIRKFAEYAVSQDFKIIISTNGILASTVGKQLILDGNIYKINFSLHSFESNNYKFSLENYLSSCFELADIAASKNTVAVLRLWNSSFGKNNAEEQDFSQTVLNYAKNYFNTEMIKTRNGYKVKDKLFFEWGDKFDWPGYSSRKEELYCHALKLQFGILCDGSVVPCCLDYDGAMRLGNIFSSELDSALSSERAKKIYSGFRHNFAYEQPCKTCGFARKFKLK